jgi:hypothetical protein
MCIKRAKMHFFSKNLLSNSNYPKVPQLGGPICSKPERALQGRLARVLGQGNLPVGGDKPYENAWGGCAFEKDGASGFGVP